MMQNARSHSSLFIRPIQSRRCAFALHREQNRGLVGTVAIIVHRMFHHHSTALKTLASGLGWASWSATNTGRRRERALQKLTHTITLDISCTPNSTQDVSFFPSQCGLCYFFRTQNKVKRLSPVDPGISRGVADLYHS